MRVLIAGCGYVGQALALRLARRGDEVIAMRRGAMPDLEARPSRSIRILHGDLKSAADLSKLPEEVDAVVYTAGAGSPDEASYRSAYVDGVASLGECFASRGETPTRFLFASSTSVYGQSQGEWVDEDSATEPGGFRGTVLLQGEQLAARIAPESSVVRFGGIYGPGRDRLLRGVADGSVGLPAQRPYFTNRIHRDDAAGILEHLLDLSVLQPCYVGVDAFPADLGEVVTWIAERLGVTPKPASSGNPTLGRGPGHKRCRNTRLVACGYRFLFPSYREGYGALIEASASAG